MPLPAHQRCHDPERRGRSVLAQAPKTSMAASAAPHVSEDGDAGCERTARGEMRTLAGVTPRTDPSARDASGRWTRATSTPEGAATAAP